MDITQHEGIDRRGARAGAWLAAALAVDAAAFAALWPLLGTGAVVVGVVPAAFGGWLFGPLAGLAVVVGVAVLNVVQIVILAGPEAATSASRSMVAVGLLLQVGFAVGLGVLRRRHEELGEVRARLQEEVGEHEAWAATAGESEKRFRLLSEEALAGVYLIQDGLFQYVNPAFARTFGYDATEIIGRLGPDELTLPEDRPIVREHVEARSRTVGGVAHYRFRGLRKDGAIVPLEAHGRSLEIEGRTAILGPLLNRGQEARAEAELHLRLTALEVVPTGIVVTDPASVIEWANPHASALTGYSLGELKGRHTRLFGSGRQDKRFYEGLWNEIRAGRRWRGEFINRRKDGSEYVEEMMIAPVRGPDGEVERFVAAKTDVTERRDAERNIRDLNTTLQMQLDRLKALRSIDQAITHGQDLDDALHVLLSAARSGLGVDAAAVFLATEDGDAFEGRGAADFTTSIEGERLVAGAGTIGSALRSGLPQLVRGAEQVRTALAPCSVASLLEEDFALFAVAPMLVRGTVRGLLLAGHRDPLEVDDGWLTYFGGVAVQGGIMVDSSDLVGRLRATNAQLEAAYDETIEGWARALDLRDHETEGHSRRVTELTLHLAQAMDYPEQDLQHVRRGALLHDIGKMGVPDAILQKPGKLSEEEWTVMRMHTTLARDLLQPISFLGRALAIPYAHHERWDGSGYPEGLAGEAIPLEARIFAVADVYDALTSDRPYRKAWSRERTLKHILEGAGSHFDPGVVEAFLRSEGAGRP